MFILHKDNTNFNNDGKIGLKSDIAEADSSAIFLFSELTAILTHEFCDCISVISSNNNVMVSQRII